MIYFLGLNTQLDHCRISRKLINSRIFVFLFADAAGGRSTQQNKKPADAKKLQDDADDSSANTGINSTTNTAANTTGANITKDEDDVYEFKSTPKDSSSSSGDDKSDAGKGSDKSSDEKSDDQNVNVNQLKRAFSDVETNDEGNSADDETKRKKRKDSETVKEVGKGSVGSRSTPQRQEKGVKASGGPAKGVCLNKSITVAERKSPCPSPKPPPKTTDSDAEADDKNGDNFGSTGPKVPPLKIVIPQQGMSGDQETGSRNGKNASTRNHAALPYVVASSSNSNDSADKESVSSRCTSPSDSAKSVDEKKMSNEEQRQQRVLRSSHRGGQSVDRGSNNSSPQLQSSSPSPAASTGDPPTNEAAPKQTSTSTPNNNPSPANPPAITDADSNANVPSPSSTTSTKESIQNTVDLHPRKRKIRASKEENKQSVSAPSSSTSSTDNNDNVPSSEIHPHDQPITNCYQMYINIRQQIERKHRNLFPVQPKAPQGFQDYLMNRRTYVLDSKAQSDPTSNSPNTIAAPMKDLFSLQEKERHKLKMQHVVEKEKLVLAVEQEILRVHSRAARALANQSLPFSACTILRDEEVYNMITPEQEEKDRNARSRYNGRLFISWLQDVDDKWEKIKVSNFPFS